MLGGLWNKEYVCDVGPIHTYLDLFENASFLSVLGSRSHGDVVLELFENALQFELQYECTV